MSENYGLTTVGSYSPNELIAGGHPAVELPVIIASGSAAMSQGALLGKISANGKYKAYNKSATDGTQFACAILAHDIPAASADMKAYAFVHGVFNKNAIAGLTAETAADLQNNSIYVKEVY